MNDIDSSSKSSRPVNERQPAKGMEGAQRREVVLEIEHIKVIRKRAKTKLGSCVGCKKTTDFISVPNAADLFSTTTEKLFEFAQAQSCNFRIESDGSILLCLSDLLTAMSKRMRKGTVKLLGEAS